MASESSLLQKWHPAYRTSVSGIQLEIARHPAYQKGGFILKHRTEPFYPMEYCKDMGQDPFNGAFFPTC